MTDRSAPGPGPSASFRIVQVDPSLLEWARRAALAVVALFTVQLESDDGTRWQVQQRTPAGWRTVSEHNDRYRAELDLKHRLDHSE